MTQQDNGGADIMKAMVAVEDFINEPTRIFGDYEPWQVCEYRHALYRVWREYADALLAARSAK